MMLLAVIIINNIMHVRHVLNNNNTMETIMQCTSCVSIL